MPAWVYVWPHVTSELNCVRPVHALQGQHKIQRGYLPSMTYSSHYVRDPYARGAIQSFLRREVREMDYTIAALTEVASPFKTPPVEDVFGAMDELSRDSMSSDSEDAAIDMDVV